MDVIIEAGQRLGKYLREELDGRVTSAHVKKLCAIATDILPGDRYEQARGLLTLCQRYHLLENYSESSFDRDTRVKEIVHTLVDRGMLAEGFALRAAALVVIICEDTPDAERFARRVVEEGENPKPTAPTPVPQKSQPITQTTPPTQPTQPTQPQKPNNPSDFDILGGVLLAYRGRDEHVVVPSSVTEIAGKAFADCTFLKSVVVPDSVKVIGSAVFTGCSSLESITLPFVGAEMKRKNDSYIKPFGFIFGTKKYNRSISATQNYFGTYYIPETLKHVTITGGYMLDSAFAECKNIETITFTPEKDNEEIAHWMFRRCESLRCFCIPDGVKCISTAAFTSCLNLQNITMPEGVVDIYPSAFYDCRSLTTISLPSSIKTIEKDAFSSCKSLKELTIPASTISIGEKAFEHCAELEKVIISKSDTEIGKDAFKSCPKLTIYKEGGLKPLEQLFGTKWNPDRRPVKKI